MKKVLVTSLLVLQILFVFGQNTPTVITPLKKRDITDKAMIHLDSVRSPELDLRRVKNDLEKSLLTNYSITHKPTVPGYGAVYSAMNNMVAEDPMANNRAIIKYNTKLSRVENLSSAKPNQDITLTDIANVGDSLALVALYNQCGGPNWTRKTNWLTGPLVSWEGVIVENGRVVVLDQGDYWSNYYWNTPSVGLVGPIPAELSNLTEIVVLRMYNNQLTGLLPASWSALVNLQNLSLGKNQLTGSLPESWSALVNLQEIYLNDNQLSGTLPLSWPAMINLYWLGLWNNQFTGPLPEIWSAFGSLILLDINGNQLSGTLPESWSALVNLQHLALGWNQFTGTLPLTWPNLVNLTQLALGSNQLTGTLPENWSEYDSLKRLRLDRNQFTGTLPAGWSSLVHLQQLILSYNQFTGTLPPSWSSFVNLWEFLMDGNQLSGTLPASWSSFVNLYMLILNDNQLTGTLPPSWSSMVEMKDLYLYNNQLTGTLPESWSSMVKMHGLILNNNELTSTLPASWSSLTQLWFLFLHHNHFTGPLPESWSALVNLNLFYVTSNQLSGALPVSWTNMPNLNAIVLDSNRITGLPNLTSMPNIGYLAVGENRLDFGDIEPNIGITTFQYAPQALVGVPDTVIKNVGDEFSVPISAGGTSNQYQWYKNQVLIPGATSNVFVIPHVYPWDSGYYTCRITNTIATGLTLNSYPTKLQIVIIPSTASVTTAPITGITQTTATGGGEVTNGGGSGVSARGVCWNTSPNPTISDNHTLDGSGTGVFASNLTGLTYNTTYYVRAYADSIGTAYGDQVSFTTSNTEIVPCPGTPTITYGGKTYNTIQIGTQCWLRENLAIGTRINGVLEQTDNAVIEKYCFNDLESNCDIYGGLYQWNEMMQYVTAAGVQGICPAGWHIPSNEEWTFLSTLLGGDDIAGGKMKETGTIHWTSPNAGATNESAFTALPGGVRTSNGLFFFYMGDVGYYRSSTETSSSSALIRMLFTSGPVLLSLNHEKGVGMSCRCIKDPMPVTAIVNGTATGSLCYNATQTINVAGNGTTFTVQSGGSATMIAGQNIVYLPTTSVQPGGYMRGYIAPSGPWCVAPSMPAVAMVEDEIPMSVQQSSFKVYPNPTSGTFILELTGATDQVKLDIFGIWGEKVLTSVINGERKHEFSLSDKPAGVFFIRVVSGDKAEILKIIKQ